MRSNTPYMSKSPDKVKELPNFPFGFLESAYEPVVWYINYHYKPTPAKPVGVAYSEDTIKLVMDSMLGMLNETEKQAYKFSKEQAKEQLNVLSKTHFYNNPIPNELLSILDYEIAMRYQNIRNSILKLIQSMTIIAEGKVVSEEDADYISFLNDLADFGKKQQRIKISRSIDDLLSE